MTIQLLFRSASKYRTVALGAHPLGLKYSYTVLFEPAEEGGYVAFCPALPGLITEGDGMRKRVSASRKH